MATSVRLPSLNLNLLDEKPNALAFPAVAVPASSARRQSIGQSSPRNSPRQTQPLISARLSFVESSSAAADGSITRRLDNWPSPPPPRPSAANNLSPKAGSSNDTLLQYLETILERQLASIPKGDERARWQAHRETLDAFISHLRIYGPLMEKITQELDVYMHQLEEKSNKLDAIQSASKALKEQNTLANLRRQLSEFEEEKLKRDEEIQQMRERTVDLEKALEKKTRECEQQALAYGELRTTYKRTLVMNLHNSEAKEMLETEVLNAEEQRVAALKEVDEMRKKMDAVMLMKDDYAHLQVEVQELRERTEGAIPASEYQRLQTALAEVKRQQFVMQDHIQQLKTEKAALQASLTSLKD